ncbi:MAG: T9SS type A sorting domain-containing protein [Ignavibacteriales bacterium]|nr:T9SS type A sorting domain-containing protein [Ignavibacteria bacterium]MCZ2143080.1 T9SS type A sorting domain-containing protein [Ignavibacteriales bacterium]
MRKLFFLSLFAVFLSDFVFAQTGSDWKWQHPSPQGNNLRAVQYISPTTWYAAGFSGTFMKTTDAGATWQFIHSASQLNTTSGKYSDIYDMHFFDQNNGIISCASGRIYLTSDAGNTWSPALNTLFAGTYNKMYFTDNNNGFACGTNGRLIKTINGGQNWTEIATGFSSAIYDLWASNDGQTILLASNGAYIRRSTDGGATWTNINHGGSLNYAIGYNGSVIFVGGPFLPNEAQLYASTDFGATWTLKNSGIDGRTTIRDIDFRNGAWFVTGDSSRVYKSTNNGTSWTAINYLNPSQTWSTKYYAADFSPSGDSLMVVGDLGMIQSKFGGAATPTAHTKLLKPGTWQNIAVVDPSGLVIAVGESSVPGTVSDQFARSTDGGNTWSIVPIANKTETFYSVDMIDNNLGFASGTNSFVYKTTDGGASWNPVATSGLPAGATFIKIDFVDANTGWVFAAEPNTLSNFIFKTTNGGANWVAQSHGVSGANGQIYNAHMLNANDGYAVSYQPKVFRTTNGGTTWTMQSISDNPTSRMYDIKMADTANGFIVGNLERVYKTTDGGLNWNRIQINPGNTYTFYSVEVINPETVAVFGDFSVNYISTNGGVTWTAKNTNADRINGSRWAYDNTGNTYVLFAVGTKGSIQKNALSLVVVPVELAAFSASVTGNDVLLSWSTATELNNRGFDIERKDDSGNRTIVGFVGGNGTTTQVSNYAFTDKGVAEGKYSYRLKQSDYSGSFSYSNIVEVEVGTPMTFALDQNYPNPFNPATTIAYRIPEASVVTLKVFDITGTEMATLVNTKQEAGSYTVNFDASKLASGMYIFTIKAGEFTATKKMMLLK